MRSQGILARLAAVLVVLAVSACGSSASNATSNGASVGSSAMRSRLEQGILSSTADVKAPEAKKIVDCLIAKMSAAGIKTNGEAESHQDQVTQFSTACAEKVAASAG